MRARAPARESAEMSASASHRIDLEPVGRHGLCRADEALVELTRALGVELISVCGGHGHCGRCRVRIVSGAVSEPSQAEREQLTDEELAAGMRLACRTWPRGDCVVYLPADSLGAQLRSQVEGRDAEGVVASLVRSAQLELVAPTLEHAQADADTVLAARGRSGHRG